MKILFSLLFVFIFLNGFSQKDFTTKENNCSDSIIKSFNNFECIENTDTLYEWTVEFDSVSIEVYNKWGAIVKSSVNPYTSISELFDFYSSEKQLPNGTYYIFIKSYKDNEEKSFCYYFQYMKTSCACG